MTFSFSIFNKHWPLSLLCWAVGSVSAVSAQTLPTPSNPSFQQALEAAWQRSSAARTQTSRLADLQAQRNSVNSFLAGAPELTLAHRTDRLHRNGGLREWEAEIEAPIQRPQVRQAQLGQLDAQQLALSPQQRFDKLKLAGQLRELLAQARLSQVDIVTARAKLEESRQLVEDMERRLRVGDVARLDALQSQAAQSQAQAQLDAGLSHLQQLQLQWQGLTGQTLWPQDLQTTQATTNTRAVENTSIEQHPAWQAAQAYRDVARNKLRAAEVDNRDPMTVALGLTRERGAFGQSSDGTLRLALRIPFGSEQRNAPRLSSARLELDTAEAELELTQRSLQSEVSLRQSQVLSARAAQEAAKARLALIKQAHELILRAWRLGDRSLAERLRADGERFEAEQLAARAIADVINAQAQLDQAAGLMP